MTPDLLVAAVCVVIIAYLHHRATLRRIDKEAVKEAASLVEDLRIETVDKISRFQTAIDTYEEKARLRELKDVERETRVTILETAVSLHRR